MGKHEFLPFKMTVERGHLVPATPFDAERLDTWRNGSVVNVTFVRDGGRVMERKWFAILNRAVKECKTPWKTSAEASEAVKLSIGVVNLTKTVGGDFLTYPKSLTELSDPELDEAVDLMIDVIHRVTGVDPSEWRKQVEHIKEHASSEGHSDVTGDNPVAGEGSGDSPSLTAPENSADEAEQSETGAQPSETANEAHGETSTAPVSETEMMNSKNSNTSFLKAEMVRKLLQLAGDTSLTMDERLENLKVIHPGWVERMPGHPTLVSAVFNTTRKVIRGELMAADARRYLEGL